MKSLLSKLALVFILVIPVLAYNHTWIMLGTAAGQSFEIDPVPADEGNTTVGFAKNVFLEGDKKGITVIHHLEFDCPSNTIRQISAEVYDANGNLLFKGETPDEWHEAKKGSYADQTLNKYWCKNI